MHPVIQWGGVVAKKAQGQPMPRRRFLILGALAAAGCGETKDTPETKAFVPPSVQAKESFEQVKNANKRKAGGGR